MQKWNNVPLAFERTHVAAPRAGNVCFLLKIAPVFARRTTVALLNIGLPIIKENTSEIERWWLAAHREGWANLDGYQGKRYVK